MVSNIASMTAESSFAQAKEAIYMSFLLTNALLDLKVHVAHEAALLAEVGFSNFVSECEAMLDERDEGRLKAVELFGAPPGLFRKLSK